MQDADTLDPPVKDRPAIAGLRFRHFQGATDYAALAAVATAERRAQGVDWTVTEDDVAVSYAHMEHSDPVKDSIIAEVDGAIIASGRTRWRDEDSGPLVHGLSNYLMPEYRDSDLRRVILTWLENRAGHNAATQPASRIKVLETYSIQGDCLDALLQDMGYTEERYFAEMVRPSLDDIPDFALPDGLEVRPVQPEQYRVIWEAEVEAFRDHWGFTEPTELDYERFLAEKRFFQPELWQVAWDANTNEVAGMVRPFIDYEENKATGKLRGYTENISTRRPYRQRGLARALIVRSLHAQREAGMTESALGVDMASLTGATRVYEDCGFRVDKLEILWRKPLGI